MSVVAPPRPTSRFARPVTFAPLRRLVVVTLLFVVTFRVMSLTVDGVCVAVLVVAALLVLGIGQ